MEHYITEIKIDKLGHLSDITISLNPERRQHLMITGKNGSGKTSLLLALQAYLQAINDGQLELLVGSYLPNLNAAKEKLKIADNETEKLVAQQDYQQKAIWAEKYIKGIDVQLNEYKDLDFLYQQGDFITAFFPANRKTQIIQAHGVEDIRLSDAYHINSDPGQLLHKYMVHLKTQQAYARNEGDMRNAERIQKWFDRFVSALQILLDDDSIALEYDYKEYDFKIHEKGRKTFGFDELSDGYSSVIHIMSDLILRMDKNWLLSDKLSEYTVEGIVLIDELETHLHIELQKKILPFLTEFFPRLQFIITTHSPYILNSISNAKAYDLEKCMELENMFMYSSDSLAEGFFETDEYSDMLKESIERYRYLVEKKVLSEEERAERAKLRCQLKEIPRSLSQEAREKFDDIEGKRL